MKILTVVGARPQFIKAAMVSRAIAAHNTAIIGHKLPDCDCSSPIIHRPGPDYNPLPITEVILHTGQHYDRNMSDIFFTQMGIPEPAVNLDINGGSHGAMTGKMLFGIEAEILSHKPDWVLVYGDTNSTLAAALAAVKLHVPLAHVEAGLRSFNRRMPEEINRVLTDCISSLLFCPTRSAVANLAREGITKGVHHVGDVMYDAAIVFGEIAAANSSALTDLGLDTGEYLLATVHRAENTDDPVRMKKILNALQELSETCKVVFPVHPRTRQKMSGLDMLNQQREIKNLQLIPPVSFLDMVQLEKNARCILTDSGGVQKEAYFHGVPCVTLREETEWVETVTAGWNQVVGADVEKICSAVNVAASGRAIPEYGNGCSSEAIVKFLRNAAP